MTMRSGEPLLTNSFHGSAPRTLSRKAVRSTLDAACETAVGIENRGDRVAALARVAVLRHRAGDRLAGAKSLSAALADTRRIDDASVRGLALARIARARAVTGARRGRLAAQREVAMAHAATGEFAAAAALAERLADGRDRDRTLNEAAALAASAGEHPQALDLARRIEDGDARVRGLRQKSFYVEISRARDRAELVTDDKTALKEQLEAATGERIAALEAVEPDKAKGGDFARSGLELRP